MRCADSVWAVSQLLDRIFEQLDRRLRLVLDRKVVRVAGPALQMSETPLAVQGPSPALGQHNEEVLSSLGYSDAEIVAFRESGVIC